MENLEELFLKLGYSKEEYERDKKDEGEIE